jgi:hypothetical protein
MGNYQPEVGEIVTAKGASSGKWYTAAFKKRREGAPYEGQSVLVQPGGARIFVISSTIKPVGGKS